ncbi:MAG: hypothetical protein ABEL76_11825 [Bradymonadaceae bacterium]
MHAPLIDFLDPPPSDPAAAGLAPMVVLTLLYAAPDAARAQSARLESRTIGRATQFRRIDGSTVEQRRFIQGLSLSGYDLLGNRTGSIRARADVRYATDFALPTARRDTPPFDRSWNDVAIRLAYVRWRPIPGVELTAGRQWARGPLGLRDLDGLHVHLEPNLGAAAAPVTLYGGRDVQRGMHRFATDVGDVPGSPGAGGSGDGPEQTPWIAGGRVGLRWGVEGSLQFAYRRRWRRRTSAGAHPRHVLGSERLGLATSVAPTPRLTVSSAASYHTLLERPDRAEVNLTWELPADAGRLSAGVEHRVPWFDASSIYNVFGAYPHRGARLSHHVRLDALSTAVRARSWARLYTRPMRPSIPAPVHGRRLGGALSHRTDIRLPGRIVEWTSEASVEGTPGVAGGRHLTAETGLTVPMRLLDRWEIFGRLSYLRAEPGGLRRTGGWATTIVAGTSLPISDFGTFRLTGETTRGSIDFDQTNLYVTIDVDVRR